MSTRPLQNGGFESSSKAVSLRAENAELDLLAGGDGVEPDVPNGMVAPVAAATSVRLFHHALKPHAQPRSHAVIEELE